MSDLPENTADYWDTRYRGSHRVWSGNPNPTLVAEASELAPGRALDVGCGEGADALWLAEHGWTVVGADLSSVALGRAAEHAADLTLTDRVEWRQVDLVTEPPEPAAYDLVTSHFTHTGPEQRDRLFPSLVAAVRPGGTLVVVAHDYSDIAAGMPRPDAPELFHTPEDVTGLLDDGWTVQVAERRPRTATTHDGRSIEIHDVVVRARRAS